MQSNGAILPIWRSMLFVPGNNKRFINNAHTRGADAIILDLEDSVPVDQKSEARKFIVNSFNSVSQSGTDVMVRINDSLRLAVRDLEAIVIPGLTAIVVPKATSSCKLTRLSDLVSELEIEQNMPVGGISFIAQIETLDAMLVLDNIASVPRVVGMTLGTEDFSAAAGMASVPEALMGPSQSLLFAARRHQCIPYGFVGSIADYSDLEKFKTVISQARQLGFCGAMCVHPSQVSVINEGYLPTVCEIELANKISIGFAESVAKGQGAFSIDGKMIDKPVLDKALQQLEYVSRFQK